MVFSNGSATGSRRAPGVWNDTAAHGLPRAADAGMVALAGRAGFERLLPQWRELAERSGRLSFMQHPDWYRALFDSGLVNLGAYRFVATFSGARLSALVPLVESLQRLPVLGYARCLGLCNHPHMDLADIVVDDPTKHSNLIASLQTWLEEARPVEWDMLAFEKIPDRSTLRQMLTEPTQASVIASYNGSSAHLLTCSEGAALGAVSTSFRRNLRRLARRAQDIAPLRFEICRSPETLEPALAYFLALEASGWKGRNGRGSAIANHPRLVAFYRALTTYFGRNGQCVIQLLYHGDQIVSAHYGLLTGGCLNLLKIAYSEADAAIAPGYLLMERAIQWCCEQPDIDELSFVTEPAWSDKWKPRLDPVRTYRLFAPTLKGRVLKGALRVKHLAQGS